MVRPDSLTEEQWAFIVPLLKEARPIEGRRVGLAFNRRLTDMEVDAMAAYFKAVGVNGYTTERVGTGRIPFGADEESGNGEG